MKPKIILLFFIIAFIGCKKETTVKDELEGVKIGTQTWSKYNYDYTGGMINIKANWGETTQSGYCYFNNDSSKNYGCLYNFNAIQSMRIPEGWKIPTNADWEILAEFLGGKDVAGGKMKTTGTTLTGGNWLSPNLGATNESGFSAEPWGNIRPDGGFDNMTVQAGYWSSSTDGVNTYVWTINYSNAELKDFKVEKGYGWYLRLIKL